ncbi:MAG: hypothetical protein IKE46_08135 [Selenomonadaceae bacterium]|nr:hypothetical protein [Selenomonadaceae bacterium]MBR4384126.1 hypothetical protein [Selenomonadaceae bacterium]
MDYQTLNSVWELKLKYDRETHRLEDLRFLAHPSTPPMNGMPHATAQASKVEKLATLIVDAERTIQSLADQIETQKFKLLSLLNQTSMDELPQRVINYRYVGCQSFNAIAKLLHYTRQYIIRLHDKGLNALNLDGKMMISFRAGLRIAQCCR